MIQLGTRARCGTRIDQWLPMTGRVTPAPDLAYQTSAGSSANATSYTFSSQTFGTEYAARVLVVTVGYGSGITNFSLNTVTIGGVLATLAVNYQGSVRGGSAIAYATVPTGTTGSVVVSLNGTGENCGISIWSSPVALAVDNTSSGNSSVTVNGIGNAVLVTGHWGVYGTWTGLTSTSYDVNVESTWHHAGGVEVASGSKTISNSGSTYPSMAAAVFKQAV